MRPRLVLGVTLSLGVAAALVALHGARVRPAQRATSRGAASAPGAVTRHNHALSLGWGASAETTLDARRLDRDHTLLLRFMAAYEAAYRGVALADESGAYHVGLAPYASLGAPAVEISVGGATTTYPLPHATLTDNDFRRGAPRQPPAKWRTLALRRRAQRVTVYLDGVRLGDAEAGELPAAGRLRLGRLAKARGAQDQFYGFIDDVTLSDGALDDATLARTSASALGSLPAGAERLDFEASTPGAAPAYTLRGGARIAALSATRDAALDSASLPRPAHATRFTLPFAERQVWMVIQGMNSGLSHNDIAAFALDFIRVDPRFVADNPARLPGGSHAASYGAAALAAAPGRVVALVDCFADDNSGRCGNVRRPPAAANRNLTCLQHTAGESSCVLHLRQGSAAVKLGDDVAAGAQLGRVGNTGVPTPHLHFAVSDRPEPNAPAEFSDLVTLPFSFSDYFASDDFGATWRHVDTGTPTPGQWLTRSLPTPK